MGLQSVIWHSQNKRFACYASPPPDATGGRSACVECGAGLTLLQRRPGDRTGPTPTKTAVPDAFAAPVVPRPCSIRVTSKRHPDGMRLFCWVPITTSLFVPILVCIFVFVCFWYEFLLRSILFLCLKDLLTHKMSDNGCMYYIHFFFIYICKYNYTCLDHVTCMMMFQAS